MIQGELVSLSARQPPKLRWGSEPVETFIGTIDEVADEIPSFERRPFFCAPKRDADGGTYSANLYPANNRYDLIVRTPFGRDRSEVPVGVVSKKYGLLQHKDLFDGAVGALKRAGVELADVKVSLSLTEYRGRMGVRFLLPEPYAFDPGDGKQVGLRLECFNSVDGSSRLWVVLGWLRFVCSNGLVLGTTRLNVRRIHNGRIDVKSLGDSLERALTHIDEEEEVLTAWTKTQISEEQLIRFVDGPLMRKWGAVAAARTYHICLLGRDGAPRPPFEKTPPHLKRMSCGACVGGAPIPAQTAYDVSQALAWLAKERCDVNEQLERGRDIPALMRKLLNN